MASAQNNNLQPSRGVDEDANGFERWCKDLDPECVGSWAVTEKIKQELTFLWKLENFSTMIGREKVKSPVLYCVKAKQKWQIKVEPKRMIENTEYFGIHIFLKGNESPQLKLNAKFQFSILNGDGKPVHTEGGEDMAPLEFDKRTGWGFNKMIRTADLLSASGPNRVLNNDCLSILVNLWVDKYLNHQPGSLEKERLENKHQANKEKLVSDIGNLFTNNVLTDFALISENNTIFRVHKFILAARSSFFENLFKEDPNKKPLMQLHVHFNQVVVKSMIEFIYTGEAEYLQDNSLELLEIAEFYDVHSLKECCEELISSNITIENASDLLIIAHKNNASVLKSILIEFINWNKEAVQATVGFRCLAQEYPNLVGELYMARKI